MSRLSLARREGDPKKGCYRRGGRPAGRVGEEIAEARISTRDPQVLAQLDAERDDGARERHSSPAPTREAKADRERGEQQKVEDDVGAAILSAYQAEERRLVGYPRGRRDRIQREGKNGGETGEGEESPTDARVPVGSSHCAGTGSGSRRWRAQIRNAARARISHPRPTP